MGAFWIGAAPALPHIFYGGCPRPLVTKNKNTHALHGSGKTFQLEPTAKAYSAQEDEDAISFDRI